MPLTAGTRFGRYDIVGPLGAGGMGDVYRARDSKLHREVVPETTPPEVRELLERCLRKNPRSRLRDIGDARVEIEDWLARPEKTRFVAPPRAAAPVRRSPSSPRTSSP
jgi:serine/threonine protein kinase